MFFSSCCGGCGHRGPSPCAGCIAELRALDGPVDLADVVATVGAAADAVIALVDYDGVARGLVAQLKFRNDRSAVAWFATALADRVAEAGITPDLVTWVPSSLRRRRGNGLDAVEPVARALARKVGAPVRRRLRRADGGGQTGRGRTGRLEGPSLLPVGRSAGVVVVVDDVVTTGATLRTAAGVLRRSGADAVVVAALAHPCSTPAPTVDRDAGDVLRNGERREGDR